MRAFPSCGVVCARPRRRAPYEHDRDEERDTDLNEQPFSERAGCRDLNLRDVAPEWPAAATIVDLEALRPYHVLPLVVCHYRSTRCAHVAGIHKRVDGLDDLLPSTPDASRDTRARSTDARPRTRSVAG